MKFTAFLVFLFGFQANAKAPEKLGYGELLALYSESGAASPEDITGAFGGICDTNPKMVEFESYGNEARRGVFLVGVQRESGLHIAMYSYKHWESFRGYWVYAPDHPIEWYQESNNFQSVSENLTKITAELESAKFSSRDWLTSFVVDYGAGTEKIHFHAQQRFRKTKAGDIIAVIVGLDEAPTEIQGIQKVCHWFKRFR